MAKQTFTTGQVLTAAQMTTLQANDYNQTVSAKTASYVLVAADAGTRITMSNAGATTITVNTGLFTAGDTLIITNIGAGACTITAGTATVSTAGSLILNQYDSGTLYFSSASAAIWNGANPGDITGVTAGTGISGGGTSGTVTITNSMATEITAAGDIIVGTGSGTFDNLPIGTTGQILTADTTVSPYKVKWAAGSTGKLIQVVAGTTTTVVSSATNTYVDTTLTATITPTLSTSTILVIVQQNGAYKNSANAANAIGIRLLRGATEIASMGTNIGYSNSATIWEGPAGGLCYLDSPATTSATTYKTQVKSQNNTATVYVQDSAAGTTAMSTITLMEIGA